MSSLKDQALVVTTLSDNLSILNGMVSIALQIVEKYHFETSVIFSIPLYHEAFPP